MTDEELVYVRGIPPEATYQFKHALVQDAAYESLLRSRRHELHRKIAAVLSERFPDVAEAEPELLAHHHAAAGDVAAAVDAWQRAGERAVGRSAVAEAIEHFGRALGLVERLPDTPSAHSGSSRSPSCGRTACRASTATPRRTCCAPTSGRRSSVARSA
jgi:predicted ATPase